MSNLFDFIKAQPCLKINNNIKAGYNKFRHANKNSLLCNAPFSSLYFQPDGRVAACCFYRIYELGRYPDKSISDIWNSEKIDRLRKYIRSDNLSYGCNLCYYLLKAGDFGAVPAQFYDNLETDSPYPTSIEFELENTCNLECVMCVGNFSSGIRKNRLKLPPLEQKYDKAFLNSLDQFIPHLKQSKFIGGEPFLINIYYSIWDKIIEMNPNCLICVQTNGTLYNHKIEQYLNKGNFHVGISIDTLDKERYERIRINADLENTLGNIKLFSSQARKKGRNISISVCPMRINWQDIPDLVNFCNDLDAFIFFNMVYYPVKLTIWNLSSIEIKYILNSLSSCTFNRETYFAKANHDRYDGFLRTIEKWYSDALIREKMILKFERFNETELEKRLDLKLSGYFPENIFTDDMQNLLEIKRLVKEAVVNNPLIDTKEKKRKVMIRLINLPVESIMFEVGSNNSFGMIETLLLE